MTWSTTDIVVTEYEFTKNVHEMISNIYGDEVGIELCYHYYKDTQFYTVHVYVKNKIVSKKAQLLNKPLAVDLYNKVLMEVPHDFK